MDFIKDFFSTMSSVWLALAAIVLLILFLWKNWEKVSWWWLNVWYSFPLIGKISQLAKDTSKWIKKNSPDDEDYQGWYKSELTLCGKFFKFLPTIDEDHFKKMEDYLSKAGDAGRTPMPWQAWVLSALLVFFEAMGFSYVLAGYSIPGASENVQEVGATVIAFLTSVVLLFVTHLAGSEQRRATKMKDARRDWVDANRPTVETRNIALAHDQSIDNSRPGYEQLWNRHEGKGKRKGWEWPWRLAAVAFILIVAVGSTYVRGQVLEKQLQQQIMGQLADEGPVTIILGSKGSLAKKSHRSLPADDAKADLAAKRKSLEDEKILDTKGGWGTFGLLAVLFVFLQSLSGYFGYKYCFTGNESKTAYEQKGGYISLDDVRKHEDVVVNTAQEKLEVLQGVMEGRDGDGGGSGIHTAGKFSEYVNKREEEKEKLRRRKRELKREREEGRQTKGPLPSSEINNLVKSDKFPADTMIGRPRQAELGQSEGKSLS